MWEYYRRNLTHARDQDTDLWRIHLPVLATLGVIGEPVTFELLCDLAGVAPNAELQRTVDGTWFPFLQIQTASDDDQDRYTIYHASVGDFLSGRATGNDPTSRHRVLIELRNATAAAHRRIADRYLHRWGGLERGLPRLHDLARDPDRDDRYGLSYLTAHLLAVNRDDELHRLLAAECSIGTAR